LHFGYRLIAEPLFSIYPRRV